MLNLCERERAAYISGSPQVALLAELLNADDDKTAAESELEAALNAADEAKRERDRMTENVETLLIAVAELFYTSHERTEDENIQIGDLLTNADICNFGALLLTLSKISRNGMGAQS